MPKQAQTDDVGLSIRFKHGTHTVFLFVDPISPFSKATDDLLQILRERYPEGLSRSNSRTDMTAIPEASEDVHVSYAVLKNPKDVFSGWKNLKVMGNETPASKGLKDNMVVAFAIQSSDVGVDAEPEFEVEFPTLDDEDEVDISE